MKMGKKEERKLEARVAAMHQPRATRYCNARDESPSRLAE